MKKLHSFVLITIIGITLFGCEAMAELFHGPRPKEMYTVTFDANGAGGTPPPAQIVEADTAISLPNSGSLSSTGNVFVGWNESAAGTGISYPVGTSITVTRNMVFYAQWLDASTPQYTVTFNANGATGGAAPASQTVYSGISITVPGQGTLVHSGRTFGGWNTQANGGGTNYEAGAVYTVTSNVTLYARWQSEIQYTVSYQANGANGTAPQAQTVDPGTEITLPGAGNMTHSSRTFSGWNTAANGSGAAYAEGDFYTVTGNVSFFAQWESLPVTPPGADLAAQLAYIRNYTGDGTVFDIVVNNDVFLGPTSVSTMGVDITVNIRSASPANVRTIQLEGQGHLFSLDTGVTMRLQDIVLRGIDWNDRALVAVGNANLILNSGAKITENTNIVSREGGGIYVSGGVLEINEGGEIIENSSNCSQGAGGGIYVNNRGTVTIRGGAITGNSATNITWYPSGGGIYITDNSTVTMSGGIISRNITGYYGGGVYIHDSGSSFSKRAVSGSSTSGIIYGSAGENANTIFAQGNGHAIYRNFGSLRSRNTTLGPGDGITTLSDAGWE